MRRAERLRLLASPNVARFMWRLKIDRRGGFITTGFAVGSRRWNDARRSNGQHNCAQISRLPHCDIAPNYVPADKPARRSNRRRKSHPLPTRRTQLHLIRSEVAVVIRTIDAKKLGVRVTAKAARIKRRLRRRREPSARSRICAFNGFAIATLANASGDVIWPNLPPIRSTKPIGNCNRRASR